MPQPSKPVPVIPGFFSFHEEHDWPVSIALSAIISINHSRLSVTLSDGRQQTLPEDSFRDLISRLMRTK